MRAIGKQKEELKSRGQETRDSSGQSCCLKNGKVNFEVADTNLAESLENYNLKRDLAEPAIRCIRLVR